MSSNIMGNKETAINLVLWYRCAGRTVKYSTTLRKGHFKVTSHCAWQIIPHYWSANTQLHIHYYFTHTYLRTTHATHKCIYIFKHKHWQKLDTKSWYPIQVCQNQMILQGRMPSIALNGKYCIGFVIGIICT